MNSGRSTDIVAVHKDSFPYIRQGERGKRRLKESSLTWAQPLQVLGVKPWDSFGRWVAYAEVGGEW